MGCARGVGAVHRVGPRLPPRRRAVGTRVWTPIPVIAVRVGCHAGLRARVHRDRRGASTATSATPELTDALVTEASSPGAAAEVARILAAAILDQHSVWWALASPLFALSVAPYLLFLKNIWEVPSATDEMRASFATLLLFVVVSIPAEAYTQEQYGTVLSNIDALHFLIQAAISLTNLRIMLAFRDGCRRENHLPDPNQPVPLPSFLPALPMVTTDADDPNEATADDGGWASRERYGASARSFDDGLVGWDGEGFGARDRLVADNWGGDGDAAGFTRDDWGETIGLGSSITGFTRTLRPGALVESAAGMALVGTFALMALDSRLAGFASDGTVLGSFLDHSPIAALVDGFRASSAAAANALAPGLPPGPANALSVPTWGVHVFSLVEWLVAMGLVWEYAAASGVKEWRWLTWGMLPLHASGVCACVQHFFFNAADLEWLVTAQGALTMAGNAGMCAAAGKLASATRAFPGSIKTDEDVPLLKEGDERIASSSLASSSSSSSSFDGWLAEAGIVIDGSGRSSRLSGGGERPAASTGDSDDASFGTDWYEFDVEGFATIWRDDDDASFAAKIAALSLFVAAGVRCASLASGPDFADDGDLAWARGLVAGAMMSTPLALNVAKWKRRGGSLAAEISGPFPETALGEVVGVDAEGMEELERAR